MNEINVVKELEKISSVLNGFVDVISKSPYAKEHYEELIRELLNKINSFHEAVIENESFKAKNEPFLKLNKLRCLLINLDCKLKNNNIQLPYSISKDFSEIVETAKN